jgi:hypothetical protein
VQLVFEQRYDDRSATLLKLRGSSRSALVRTLARRNEQLHDVHVESVSERRKGADGQVPYAPLDGLDVRRCHINDLGKPFLRQTTRQAQLSDTVTDSLGDA